MRNRSLKLAALAVVAVAGLAPAATPPRVVDTGSSPFFAGPPELNVIGAASATALHGPNGLIAEEAMIEARLYADVGMFGQGLVRMADFHARARNRLEMSRVGSSRYSSAMARLQLGGYVVQSTTAGQAAASLSRTAVLLDRSKSLSILGLVTSSVRGRATCTVQGAVNAYAVRPPAQANLNPTYARIAGDARTYAAANLSTSYTSPAVKVSLNLNATFLDTRLQPDYTAVKDDHYGAVRHTAVPVSFKARLIVSVWVANPLLPLIGKWVSRDTDWFGYAFTAIDKYLCRKAPKAPSIVLAN
jgi:hypothetical protein